MAKKQAAAARTKANDAPKDSRKGRAPDLVGEYLRVHQPGRRRLGNSNQSLPPSYRMEIMTDKTSVELRPVGTAPRRLRSSSRILSVGAGTCRGSRKRTL